MAERARSDVLLAALEGDGSSLEFIAKSLSGHGLRPALITLDPTEQDAERARPALESARAVALVIGSAGVSGPLQQASSLAERVTPPVPRFGILLPGADATMAQSLDVDRDRIADLRQDLHDEGGLKAFAGVLRAVREAALSATEAALPASEAAEAPSEAAEAPSEAAEAPSEAALQAESAPVPPPPRVPSPTPSRTRSDMADLWARLTPFAREAFGAAEGMRQAAGDDTIHMEHLLAGLYTNVPGAARAVIGKAGLTETSFRDLLLRVAKRPFPGPGDYDLVPIHRMPSFSGHVGEAVIGAGRIADRLGGREIRRRDLVYGALSVADCAPIEALLNAGVDREEALTWDVPMPLTTKASAQTDQPTTTDLLGYASLVDALTELLTGPDTTFPLTIAISAPWGGGKSSVMRQLQRRLRSAGDQANRWVLVDFPAWRYDTGEQLWAAMAKLTYDAGREQQRTRWARLRFRWAVERPRLSVGPIAWRITIAGAGGAIGVLAGVAVGTVTGAQAQDTATAATVGGVGGLVAVARAFWASASDPFKRAIESIATQPGIPASDGFTPDAEKQVRALFRVLLKGEGRVAIFIDDLDRCTPTNLVRVIEVVNQIFVASADAAAATKTGAADVEQERTARRLAFIFGMDRYVVARGIEAEYDKLLGVLVKYGDEAGQDFGLAFLDKIIQLWVTLPTPTRAALEVLLRTTAGFPSKSGPDNPVEFGRIRQQMLEAVKDIPVTNRAAIIEATQAVADSAPDESKVAAEWVRQTILSSSAPSAADSDEVWAAMKAGADCLAPNPRQRKRYNNAFRLQLNLASRSGGVTFSPDQLNALARWVAIRLRWGRLAQAMDEYPDLIRALERAANGRRRIVDITADDAAAQRRRTPEWFAESMFGDLRELNRILQVPSGKQAISNLPFDAFVRVA